MKTLYAFVLPGDHPKDFGHPQGPLDVLLWSAPQQQPVQGPGALAPPRYGRVPRQGEIRAGATKRRVAVREEDLIPEESNISGSDSNFFFYHVSNP